MTGARGRTALVAGALLVLGACTGGGSASPSTGASGAEGPTGSPSTSVTVLANGEPLPAGCPAEASVRSQTVAFVAGGNAWVLDPAGERATCVFPAPTPGPFDWNPRGDRALLDGLEIQSVGGKELRAQSSATSPVSSWGHPVGKAVVFVAEDGTRLHKVYPGSQSEDDITPVPDVRYLNVAYHPSGLAIAFVVDTGERQEIWLSSNVGEDPVRLVFAVDGTTFGALAFTADGTTLLYAAVHADDAPILHALDLTNPTVNQGLWRGGAGDRITTISPQWIEGGRLVAMTVGSSCETSRAMLFRQGRLATPIADAPSRAVGWLDGHTVLVASGGCASPSNLSAVDVRQNATLPLVTGVELAAARTPMLDAVPPLPQDIEQEVGAGVG